MDLNATMVGSNVIVVARRINLDSEIVLNINRFFLICGEETGCCFI